MFFYKTIFIRDYNIILPCCNKPVQKKENYLWLIFLFSGRATFTQLKYMTSIGPQESINTLLLNFGVQNIHMMGFAPSFQQAISSS